MPRLKSNDPYEKLSKLLMGARAYEGKTYEGIARHINVSPRTARRYMKNPEKLPLTELNVLRRYLGVTIEDFRDAIP